MKNTDEFRSERPAPQRPAGEQMVRVDGRGQVLDMLRAADPEFRETILRGIEKRDAKLARELRREL
jgi:hypothetical protein